MQQRFQVLTGVVLLVFASTAWADPRPFTFTYDVYPEGKGNIEYEQWVTWKTNTQEDSDFNRVEFRHEFEIGVADNFDLSFYVPTWFYEDTQDGSRTKFDTVGVEGIVYLSNPVTDFVGSGLYGEINVGEEELEFEVKLLLQKDIGKWTFAYNLIAETELEGVFQSEEENEVEGVLGHALGASYSLTPHVRVGGEMAIESIYENWNHYEDTTVYAGPTFGYAAEKHWWVTVTPAFQLSDVDDESDFTLRVVAGWVF